MTPLQYHQPDTPAPPRPGLLVPGVSLVSSISLSIVANAVAVDLVPLAGTVAAAAAWVGLVSSRRALDAALEWVITAGMGLLFANGIALLVAVSKLLRLALH